MNVRWPLLFLAPVLFSTLLGASTGSAFNEAKKIQNSKSLKTAAEPIEELKNVDIEEKTGGQVDLSLGFTDSNGKSVRLGDFFKNDKPVVLSPVYYGCPGLCNFHLNGLVESLVDVDWSVGDKYEVVIVSFDSKEDSKMAEGKKTTYLNDVYKRPESENGFHFLTGTEENIKKLTEQVGFKYEWNEEMGEWAHASAAIILTPDGKISRYLHGIMFEPKTIKLALNEASEGQIGGLFDRVMLYCFQYNPQQSKYTLAAFRVMRLGGALTIFILAAWLIPFWIRSRREEA